MHAVRYAQLRFTPDYAGDESGEVDNEMRLMKEVKEVKKMMRDARDIQDTRDTGERNKGRERKMGKYIHPSRCRVSVNPSAAE